MNLPKHIELSQAVKACKNQAMTDLIIEGNVVMAKRESNGPVIFTLLFFMGIITIAGLMQ